MQLSRCKISITNDLGMAISSAEYDKFWGINKPKDRLAVNRKVSGVRRSDPAREAEQQKRQAEYSANQDRYRGDFEIKRPAGMTQQVIVGWYNPETGAKWSAPNPGYTPKEGTGWVKGYGPIKNAPGVTKGGGGVTKGGGGVTKTASTGDNGKAFEALLRRRMSKF
jgi:hypothetical protein